MKKPKRLYMYTGILVNHGDKLVYRLVNTITKIPPPRPPQLCSWLPILSPEFVLHKLPLQLLSTLQKKFITSKQSGRAHGIVLILLHNRLEGGNQIFLIIFVKKITTYKNLVDRRSEMYISSSDLWWKNTDVHPPPPPLESY